MMKIFEDGNDVIDANGTQWWYVDDVLHRTDGPAIMFTSGAQKWYVNGKRHRIDGPACIWADGTQQWYVNGKRVNSFEELQSLTNLSNEALLALKLKYGEI